MKPLVEFFSEKVDGVEYLNVGLKWIPAEGRDATTESPDIQRAVLGAFEGEVSQEAMVIIKGLVEQAVMYVLGIDNE